MPVDWPLLYADVESKAQLALDGQLQPTAISTVEPNVAHLLAVDVDEDIGALSFAVDDAYPDIDPGLWMLALVYRRTSRGWVEASEDSMPTSHDVARRPTTVVDSKLPWIESPSMGAAGWSDEHGWSHVLYGFAPTTTARITVLPDGGSERDVRLTPFNGAFVAAVGAASSMLTAYGHDGRELGMLVFEVPGRLSG